MFYCTSFKILTSVMPMILFFSGLISLNKTWPNTLSIFNCSFFHQYLSRKMGISFPVGLKLEKGCLLLNSVNMWKSWVCNWQYHFDLRVSVRLCVCSDWRFQTRRWHTCHRAWREKLLCVRVLSKRKLCFTHYRKNSYSFLSLYFLASPRYCLYALCVNL